MARKMVDCRQLPNEICCTLTMAGEPEELLDAAVVDPRFSGSRLSHATWGRRAGPDGLAALVGPSSGGWPLLAGYPRPS